METRKFNKFKKLGLAINCFEWLLAKVDIVYATKIMVYANRPEKGYTT